MKSETVLQLSSTPAESAVSVQEEEGGLNLGQLLRTIRRKWWLIAGVTLVTTTAAGAKVLLDTLEYNSYLEILIQPLSVETEVIANVPETLTSEEDSLGSLNGDLVKILASPGVLEPVVEEVKAKYPQFCTKTVEPIDLSKVENANMLCYNSIISGLELIIPESASSILQVGFIDTDAQMATNILDIISETYLTYSLTSRQADISRGIEFVDKKLPDLRAKVNLLQEQLQNLRLSNDLVDPTSRGSQLSGQMDSFSKQQRDISVELQQNRDIYENLRSQLQRPTESASSSALADNPRYQSLLDSLLELDSKIAEESTLYLDSSPDMQVLQEERQNLLQLLAQQGRQSEQEIISRIRELESRDAALQSTIQGLNSDIGTLAGISRDYTDIERELEVATDNLTQFLTKKEALEIDAAQREIPWEIVTPTTAPIPQPVNLSQNLLLGGLLGLLLGTGLVLLLEQSAGVIRDDEEIRRFTRLPVLGRIPERTFDEAFVVKTNATASVRQTNASASYGGRQGVGMGSQAVLEKQRTGYGYGYDNDPFSESFRSLYTSLRLIDQSQPVQSIAVSSVTPGEGKSTVAIHLAQAAAEMGQKVLLVDADLRSPSLHTYLELSKEKGLTNLFSGESNPAIIQKFTPESSLYVITAGSIVMEPTRLFSSRSMNQFIEQIEPKFDLVIYDTPPLLGQSDTYIIAAKTDGLLLVTRPGQLKQSALDRAMEQLQIARINVLGLVNRER